MLPAALRLLAPSLKTRGLLTATWRLRLLLPAAARPLVRAPRQPIRGLPKPQILVMLTIVGAETSRKLRSTRRVRTTGSLDGFGWLTRMPTRRQKSYVRQKGSLTSLLSRRTRSSVRIPCALYRLLPMRATPATGWRTSSSTPTCQVVCTFAAGRAQIVWCTQDTARTA